MRCNRNAAVFDFLWHVFKHLPPEENGINGAKKYDQKIPQSKTTDKTMTPRGRDTNHHETPGRQTKQSDQPSLPHQDYCNTRMDLKVTYN